MKIRTNKRVKSPKKEMKIRLVTNLPKRKSGSLQYTRQSSILL